MRVILITGGSRGIGASAAIQCARLGFGVILTYQQNIEAADAMVRRIRHEGGKAAVLPLDLGATSSFAAFSDSVQEMLLLCWGKRHLSGVVNNAGYGLLPGLSQ